MSLVNTILKGVEQAQRSLGDLVIELQVTRKVEGAYNETTGTIIVTDTTLFVDAVPIDWEDGEVDGELVLQSDLKFIVFSQDTALDLTDIVNYNSGLYKIMNIKPVRVGTYSPVRILQLRA